MTVAIELIPDGSAEAPAEARDHGILTTYMKNAGIPDVPDTTLSGWRDVERVVYGSGRHVGLRVGDEAETLADFPDTALATLSDAIVTNINGLQTHPDGWHNVETVG